MNNNPFHCNALNLFVFIILAFMTYSLLILVEIDKKIKFHKVLGLEYMMKMKNYSNTEYLVKSWIMVIMGIVGFFVAFFQTIFIALKGTMETKFVGSVLHITKYIFEFIGSRLASIPDSTHVADFCSCPCSLLFKRLFCQAFSWLLKQNKNIDLPF